MSKLSFRARALDPSKQMPIYLAEELPDLPEYSAINRAVPQMPSGMEKEEESEHHLQRAICTGLIIPTPEVFTTDQEAYDRMYPPNYKMPRQLIHMQPLGLEQDVPDYDMDSGDEVWISQQSRRLDLTPLKFEQMMDRLEKSSGQMVVKLNEAKALLKQDDEVSIAVYDYWLNKRLKMQHPLILTVKTENRPGASSNNPYLAFRRRTEKMQTRKNRKNDETSYEKMLKLRRDLQRATTVLEMVKRREKTKREQLHLSIEIFEKRYQLRDFSGALFSELSSSLKNSRPAFAPLYTNQYSHHGSASGATPTGVVPASASTHTTGVGGVLGPGGLLGATAGVNNVAPGCGGHLYASASQYLNPSTLTTDAISAGASSGGIRKEKRQYKKRKHKIPRDKQQHQQQQHLSQQQQTQQQYLGGIGTGNGLSASALGAVAGSSALSSHHLLQLHRQSSSPAANESNIETEEDDYGSNGLGGSCGVGGSSGHHAHKLGSESDEETPFAFRRKQHSYYHRPLAHEGNWPWESKDDYGFADPKYRFTLTSIRHPRPRCIGFARRRMGRGGRVILDRIATNMDDFWSQLDYTIFESDTKSSATSKYLNIKKEPVKPASPPTVVDLLPSNAAATAIPTSQIPATTTTIKVEPLDVPMDMPQRRNDTAVTQVSDDDGVEADFDDDEYEDECESTWGTDVNISRDVNYISSLTLMRQRQRQRMRLHQKRRRRRLQQQKALESVNGSNVALVGDNNKRRRFNSADVAKGDAKVVVSAKPPIADLPIKEQLPRGLLHRLSKLIDEKSMNSISSFLLSEKVKREKLNGDDVSNEIVVDLVRQQQLQQQSQWPTHRSNNNLPSYNNNNNSSSNINKNVGVSDKLNVIKSEGMSSEITTQAPTSLEGGVGVLLGMTAATSSLAAASSSVSTTTACLTKAIKQELIDCTSGGASADDSNEPLSSIKKFASSNTTSDLAVLDDEENVNLAQLSSIIRHNVKKEPTANDILTQSTLTNATKFNAANYLRQPVNSDDDDAVTTTLNQMPDVIRQQHRQSMQLTKQLKREQADDAYSNGINILTDNNQQYSDDKYDCMSSLSPTSSQRLDVCNELLSEIRRDWLHFRPKTPTDELSDSSDCKLTSPTEPLVEWTQDTPIAVEMLCLPSKNPPQSHSRAKSEQQSTMRRKKVNNEQTLCSLWDTHSDDALFVSSTFKYTELQPDMQLLQSIYASDVTRGSSKSPETVNGVGNSNSAMDFNLSGDSLTDINLLGDGDETDETMLVNILKECDDIKTLNQATNFWNGILEGEAEVDEVAVDVETELLDCIGDKTKVKEGRRGSRTKAGAVAVGRCGSAGGKWRSGCSLYGGTIFKTTDVSSALPDDLFFQNVQPKAEPVDASDQTIADTVIKTEPADDIAVPAVLAAGGLMPVQQHTASATPSIANIPAQIIQNTVVGGAAGGGVVDVGNSSANTVVGIPHFIANNIQPQLVATSGIVHQRQPQAQLHVQQQLIAQHQQQQQHQSQVQLQEVAAVGDIITVTSANLPALHQQQQQLQQAHVQQQQQQQQQQILQLRQPRLQNVMQQLQQIQQQQQRQQLLQMQRDLLSGSPVITQYVSATPGNTGTATVTTTPLRHPTLTPIGATASGNHTIYTTSTAADGSLMGGTQKIYIQKATPTLTAQSAVQVPNSHTATSTAPASVITLSNVKLDNTSSGDGSAAGGHVVTSAATSNILTIDGNAVNASNMSSTGSGGGGVNLISTSGGHQVAVHNISGGTVQHLTNNNSGGTVQHLPSSVSSGTTPLIVTTTRQTQQQQQHQQQQSVHQPTQQIVWRQISGGTVNAASGVATTVSGADAAAAMAAAAAAAGSQGNKIVWASRPGQKRQFNGPDGATDINKLLLNRKFSQRKIITQSAQQHQIQITKHLQQLQQQQQQQQLLQQQQQQQQDDDGGMTAIEGQTTPIAGGGVTATLVGTPSQVSQQLQKVQMQGGKVIKMSSYPLLVSELNVAQQQHQQHHQHPQQQKHNSAAIAANHNYSLQPTTAIITSTPSATQQGGGSGNKIYLTSNNVGGGTNFTIATASELANAVAVQQSNSNNNNNSSNSNVNNNSSIAHKLHHYKELQNPNLKVNFVSTSNASSTSGGGGTGIGGNTVSVQHGSIVVDAKTVATAVSHSQQQQQQVSAQQQAVLLNKATANAALQQQKLKRERILNIIGAQNMDGNAATNVGNTTVSVSTSGGGNSGGGGGEHQNNKRVLYTSLLNVKPLQKNNSGQMQMQIGPGGMAHALLRGRIGNNQTIFTNMRTVPISTGSAVGNTSGTTVQQLHVAAAGGNSGIGGNNNVGGGGGNGVSVSLAQVTTSSSSQSLTHQQQQQQSLVNISATHANAAVADGITTTTTTCGALTSSFNDLKGIESVSNNNSNSNSIGLSGISNSNNNSNSGGGGANANNSTHASATSANANNNTLASAIVNR
ncbi:serine-rich adhesin for platelets [Eurosta solidaginis]|uniref:serine-rich adhesin for platelets n=1 Tax=Eurosta solidaginis TaxID=178769 RepID=UPI0035313941